VSCDRRSSEASTSSRGFVLVKGVDSGMTVMPSENGVQTLSSLVTAALSGHLLNRFQSVSQASLGGEGESLRRRVARSDDMAGI
jgi:hypothetical protein